LDPSHQGCNRCSEVVPLQGNWGRDWSQAGSRDMVLGVLAALVASGVVALTALLARLGCTSPRCLRAAGKKAGDGGSMSIARG